MEIKSFSKKSSGNAECTTRLDTNIPTGSHRLRTVRLTTFHTYDQFFPQFFFIENA